MRRLESLRFTSWSLRQAFRHATQANVSGKKKTAAAFGQRTSSSSSASSSAAASGRLRRGVGPKGASSSRPTTGRPQTEALSSVKGYPAVRYSLFYQVATQRGLLFATITIAMGELLVWLGVYVLHTDQLGIGECGSWLCALGCRGSVVEAYLDQGPCVLGVQLSPRLVLNYLAVNIVFFPVRSYFPAAVGAVADSLRRRSVFGSMWPQRKRGAPIPRAPPSQSCKR